MMKLITVLTSLILLSITSACSLIQIAEVEGTPPPVIVSVETAIPTITPSPEPRPVAGLDDEQFDLELAQAFEQRDFDSLRVLMKDRFSIAVWDTELREIPSDEALDLLRSFYLQEGSAPAVRWGTDVASLLEGSDPLGLWGPVANPVRAVHVMGLGPNAGDEAVLVIGKDLSSGKLYWHGILVPRGGYFHTTPVEAIEVVETEVKGVIAKTDLNARTGPGLDYAVIGLVRGGETAQVKGLSTDGDWWLIYCPSDTSGFCWISADPTLTETAAAP